MLADLSIWHILILVVIIMLLFGSKRIPEIGGSIGKGIQEFKRGLREVTNSNDDASRAAPPQQLSTTPPPPPSAGPKRLSE
jgi:sec-independent protein translocase protein TatA